MTQYEVQFILPVNNPEKNVRVTRAGKTITFEVPINHPDAHNLGFMDLLAAAELSGLLGLPTGLNNTDVSYKEMLNKAKRKTKDLTPEERSP